MGNPTVRDLIEQWNISRSEITSRAPSSVVATPSLRIRSEHGRSKSALGYESSKDEFSIERVDTASLPTDAWTSVLQDGRKANLLLRKELDHVIKLRDSLRFRYPVLHAHLKDRGLKCKTDPKIRVTCFQDNSAKSDYKVYLYLRLGTHKSPPLQFLQGPHGPHGSQVWNGQQQVSSTCLIAKQTWLAKTPTYCHSPASDARGVGTSPVPPPLGLRPLSVAAAITSDRVGWLGRGNGTGCPARARVGPRV